MEEEKPREESELFPRWFLVGDSACEDTCFVCAREKAKRNYESGSFGTVTFQDNTAVKVIKHISMGVPCSSALREITAFSLLGSLCNETVHCLEAPVTDERGHVSVKLERAEMSLVNFAKCARGRSRMQGFEKMSVHFVLWSLLRAVSYLNQCQLMHRDLKPGNVLVFPGPRVALCDFGGVRFTSAQLSELDVTMSDSVCTKPYAPPEEAAGKHNVVFDSYSIAATVVHYTLSCAPMYQPMTKISRRTFIKFCKPHHKLLTVVRLLARSDPEQRYTPTEALRVFEDFFPTLVQRFKLYTVPVPLVSPSRLKLHHHRDCKWDRFHNFSTKVWPTLVECIRVCQFTPFEGALDKTGCLATAFYVLNMLHNVHELPEPPCSEVKCYIMLIPGFIRAAGVLTGTSDDTEDYLGICHGMLQQHRCVLYHNVLDESVLTTRMLPQVGPNWVFPPSLETMAELQTELRL
jgi:serine/threonine protein kinase